MKLKFQKRCPFSYWNGKSRYSFLIKGLQRTSRGSAPKRLRRHFKIRIQNLNFFNCSQFPQVLCIVSGLTSGKEVDTCRGGSQPREKFRRLKKVHMRIWEIFRGILKVYQNVADTEKSMKSGQL